MRVPGSGDSKNTGFQTDFSLNPDFAVKTCCISCATKKGLKASSCATFTISFISCEMMMGALIRSCVHIDTFIALFECIRPDI